MANTKSPGGLCTDIIFGVSCRDVPFSFSQRRTLKKYPIFNMLIHFTHSFTWITMLRTSHIKTSSRRASRSRRREVYCCGSRGLLCREVGVLELGASLRSLFSSDWNARQSFIGSFHASLCPLVVMYVTLDHRNYHGQFVICMKLLGFVLVCARGSAKISVFRLNLIFMHRAKTTHADSVIISTRISAHAPA